MFTPLTYRSRPTKNDLHSDGRKAHKQKMMGIFTIVYVVPLYNYAATKLLEKTYVPERLEMHSVQKTYKYVCYD